MKTSTHALLALTVLSLAVAELDDPALDALLYAGTEEGRVFRTVLSGCDSPHPSRSSAS